MKAEPEKLLHRVLDHFQVFSITPSTNCFQIFVNFQSSEANVDHLASVIPLRIIALLAIDCNCPEM